MNAILQRIFKNRTANKNKLIAYGFEEIGGEYLFKTGILAGQFELSVKIGCEEINTNLKEIDTGDEYTLFLVESATGSFVGEVRAEYERVLTEIAQNCFDSNVFKYDQTNDIIEYIRNIYGDELEYLWQKFPDNAIARRKDNKKWYAALLTVDRKKLGDFDEEKVEILDVRAKAEDIDSIVDNVKIFPGYHMNKRHWITVCLNGETEIEKIYKLIDQSYILAKK